MDKALHAHPYTILTNLTRVAYLTVIPVVRGLLSALNGDFSAWLRSAWIDISILLLMAGIAVWRWYAITYTYDRQNITVRQGTVFRRITRIPWDKVTTLSVVSPFLLRPFRAVRLRADTLGGSFKDTDLSILLPPRQADAIMDLTRSPLPISREEIFLPDTSSIVALSMLTSNSFAGIIFVATFISQAGRLLGKGFSQMLIGTVEEAARTFAFGIPPAAAVIAYALLLGWLIAFLRSFIRYKDMEVTRKEGTIRIRGGWLTHREYAIDGDDVNFLDIRQSLFTKILKLYSLYISAVGYGKQKNDISCIIPTQSAGKFRRHLDSLFPGLHPIPRQIKSPTTGIIRYITQPLIPCLSIPLLIILFVKLFPAWHSFILFVGLMSMAPSLVFLIVRVLDFATGGIAFDGENYTIRYSKGFSLHIVVVPASKIVLVQLRQGIWQRRKDNCDLMISTKAEGRITHLCRNMPRKDVKNMFNISEIIL